MIIRHMIIVIEDVSNPAENSSVIKFPLNLSQFEITSSAAVLLVWWCFKIFLRKLLDLCFFISSQSTSRTADLFMFLPEIEDSFSSIVFWDALLSNPQPSARYCPTIWISQCGNGESSMRGVTVFWKITWISFLISQHPSSVYQYLLRKHKMKITQAWRKQGVQNHRMMNFLWMLV